MARFVEEHLRNRIFKNFKLYFVIVSGNLKKISNNLLMYKNGILDKINLISTRKHIPFNDKFFHIHMDMLLLLSMNALQI